MTNLLRTTCVKFYHNRSKFCRLYIKKHFGVFFWFTVYNAKANGHPTNLLSLTILRRARCSAKRQQCQLTLQYKHYGWYRRQHYGAQVDSMVVRRCRVYGSRLWMAKEIVGVACSKLYRQEQDDETHGQREIYIVQYILYNRLHHSTNNDATHRHTHSVLLLVLLLVVQ